MGAHGLLQAGPGGGGPFYCPAGQGVLTHGPAAQGGGFRSLQLVRRETLNRSFQLALRECKHQLYLAWSAAAR